ncbi:EthD domain-containing protein [Williamsia sp. 1135]|uniref:EthD domain-containing protein n=1 Tax=Williamsia sp. 1135 TaxID=1889262 RepID=UPI000A10CB9B|nr:EthD domain-containing protein [Williamsia sp. 1135]ORM36592.1 hypothetical protein BFL43_06940 [Williamsia sp. 1135]
MQRRFSTPSTSSDAEQTLCTDDAPPVAGFIELDADLITPGLLSSLTQTLRAEACLDSERSTVLVGSEFIVVPGDEPIVLAMALTRREGMTAEEFLEYWSTTHAELGSRVPGSEGYRQIHLDTALTETVRQQVGFTGPRFDGIAVACYSTDETFRGVLANTEIAGPLLEDERKFINHDRSAMVIGRL